MATKLDILATTADAKTPAGEPGTRITCRCRWHEDKSAVIPAGAEHLDNERIHNLVALAYHPVLRNAPSQKRFGPWAA